MSSSQALVEKHLYELPTCVLEVELQRSPLSEWSERPIVQNLHFRLALETGQTWFSSGRKAIKGNQAQLGKLIVAVADYVDRFLADDLVTNLTHKLSVPGLARLNLSTLQLFDLVSNLEQCAIAMTILPAVELEVKRITPAWLKVAAIVIATIGISTSAVKLIFRSPTPELVTSANRDREVVERATNPQRQPVATEKPANSQLKPDAIAPVQPKESYPVAPSSKSKSDRDRQGQISKQAPTPATPSTSQPQPSKREYSPSPTPRRESPPNTIIAQSPPLESSAPSPQPLPPDKVDKVTSSSTSQNPSAVAELQPEQRSVDNPSLASNPSRAITPPKPLAPESSKEPIGRTQNKPLSPPAAIIPKKPGRENLESRQPEVFGYSRTTGKRSPTLTAPVAPPVPVPAPVPAPSTETRYYISNIQIGDIETDLSQDVKTSLIKHIQTNSISADRSGSVVFDLAIEQGKVVQARLAHEASTLQDNEAINKIERSLLNWRSPTSTNGKIRLTIRVQKR